METNICLVRIDHSTNMKEVGELIRWPAQHETLLLLRLFLLNDVDGEGTSEQDSRLLDAVVFVAAAYVLVFLPKK